VKIVLQGIVLTIISELTTFLLFGLISIPLEGIRQTLIDFPALVVLGGSIYFPLYLLITSIYFFGISFLVKRYPPLQCRIRRIGYSFLSFLLLIFVAALLYYCYARFVNELSLQYIGINVRDFLVSFAYCPVVILMNEFIYPKWFSNEK
jgi:hypothetical protein